MTNLVLTAVLFSQLQTNMAEVNHDPKYSDQRNAPPPLPSPNEVWQVTTVQRVDKLQFEWLGETREVTTTTALSTNVVHLKKKVEWVKQ